jgi:type II secretory pathway pseudopilin PulG
MNKNTTAQGFTLNELLIALSIAMLLAAMVFPVLSRARAESEENICMNNLKQIGVALKMYAEDQGWLRYHGSRYL